MPGSAGARGTGGPSPLPSPLPRRFGTDEPEPLHHFQFSFMERSTCCHLLPNAQCKSAFTFMVLINLIISCARWAGERQAPVPCSRPPLTKSLRFRGKKQLRAWNWGELHPGVQIPYCHRGISCEFINIVVLLPCGYPRLQLPGRRAGPAPTGSPTALSLLEQAHHHHHFLFFFLIFFQIFFFSPYKQIPQVSHIQSWGSNHFLMFLQWSSKHITWAHLAHGACCSWGSLCSASKEALILCGFPFLTGL